MTRKMKAVFSLFLVSALVFTGCGSSGQTGSASSDVSGASSAASSSSSSDTASGAASSVSSNPSDSALTSTVVTESNKAEGVNVAPGTSVELAAGAVEGVPGTACPVPTAKAVFQLTVNSIALTDIRNSHASAADQVVRISFTYQNTGSDDMLLIGQTSFKLLDSDGKACEIYYFDTTTDSGTAAVPAAKGDSATTAIGFILTGASRNVTLVYDDQQTGSGTEYYWKAAL